MENNQEKNIESQFEDRERYKALAKKFLELIVLDLDKADKAFNELADFQKENPEVKNFELWHTLIGSTPPDGLVFDSDDRKISKFVDELAEKYLAR